LSTNKEAQEALKLNGLINNRLNLEVIEEHPNKICKMKTICMEIDIFAINIKQE
jgi:hypothetical protein